MTQTPVDVRLMNATASLAFFGVFTLVCVAVGLWLLRNPAFAITEVVVHGNPQHNSAASLQANVLPQLKGNLFSLDLAGTRRAFEQMPWVRNAELRRGFPNTLEVFLQEHEPVALWDGPEDSTMLNAQGEVFQANRGEVEHLNLPNLAGPPEQSQQVLQMYRYLEQQMLKHARNAGKGEAMQPVALYLTPHGSWQMFLGNGAQLELGPGQQAQVGDRLDDFFTTLPQVLAPLGVREQALAYADLRHRNGYAIRLRGVVTQGDEGEAEAAKTGTAAQPAQAAPRGNTQRATATAAASTAATAAGARAAAQARPAQAAAQQRPAQSQASAPKPAPATPRQATQTAQKPAQTQAAQKPAAQKPAAQAQAAQKPAAQAQKPAQTQTQKPAAQASAKPAASGAKPATTKPAAASQPASKPAQAAGNKPATNKPATNQPASNKPASNKPAASGRAAQANHTGSSVKERQGNA